MPLAPRADASATPTLATTLPAVPFFRSAGVWASTGSRDSAIKLW